MAKRPEHLPMSRVVAQKRDPREHGGKKHGVEQLQPEGAGQR